MKKSLQAGKDLKENMVRSKRCSKCKKWKSLFEFSKDKSTKDGLRSPCRKCVSIYDKKHHQTKAYKKWRKKHRHIHKIRITNQERKYRQTFIGHLYQRFQHIKQRCNNPKNVAYKYYGGRGIKCLFKSSDEFIDYIINELQINPKGLDIDRIDNNGHYEPGNIRIVTHAENMKNMKRK